MKPHSQSFNLHQQHAHHELPTTESSLVVLENFLKEHVGSMLRAWIHGFDPDAEHRVTEMHFGRYLRSLHCPFDPGKMWEELDKEKAGDLTLEALSERDDVLWMSLVKFMNRAFPEGIEELFGSVKWHLGPQKKEVESKEDLEQARITPLLWEEVLQGAGWTGAHEAYLFDAISGDTEHIMAKDMNWFDLEIKRSRRKAKAKAMAAQDVRGKIHSNVDPKATLEKFLRTVKQKNGGSLIRAFRKSLGASDNLTLQKAQFLRACAELGWKENVKDMWQVMDNDSSGSVTVEELDYKNAENLAKFSQWINSKFGSAANAFAVLDLDGTLGISEAEFLEAVKAHGFPTANKHLFMSIDVNNRKRILLEDMYFLDKWKPRAFLQAAANPRAASDVKARFLAKHNSYLRAWRIALDKDGSNQCNWDEFRDACRHLGYNDDVPGAWRALDSNLVGNISLQDLDPTADQALHGFRTWARSEFGSVKCLFHAFDDDNSGEITFSEFRRSCRIYGFRGKLKPIFQALDSSQGPAGLSLGEVAFLDNWSEKSSRNPTANQDARSEDEDEKDKKRLPQLGDAAQDFGDPMSGIMQAYASSDWGRGELHPAFRSWANSRRRQPVRKTDGTLPSLTSQVDLGSPRVARRPILLLAPVPVPGSQSARNQRDEELERYKAPAGGFLSERGGRRRRYSAESKTMPSLDALLSPTRFPKYARDKSQKSLVDTEGVPLT
mmetsp:Transcript_11998/g.21255  ORF Transcript_11998/g.21255 Transcript_11998/m.21255 type:complete len:721 (+) Transcript_11998:50-2212(+)|eukprot:CAMPEP_0197631092 /NCGR_PEP_ID=MMETSP1338-20131121/8371_1 /TAXON_ID=43686 ORGANISM="Pelagodinium beii, Strain RCC1491" /NCGR_SAMPLE_ID=MMETSP1338 /ASSEMBLY_ACC=CAM_ASM_000754 /LENGTH=720 /DNA_ID=CAMNT_0043202481 /DNA_START=50 /DNA_END=2212 /DNA_ORIENTATION=+